MKKSILTAALLVFAELVAAQSATKEVLQLHDIVAQKYAAKGIAAVQSLPDGEHYTTLSADKKAILKHSYTTGKITDTIFHVDKVREIHLNAIEGYAISATGTHILVWNEKEYVYRRSWKAKVYDYDVRRNYLKPLSDAEGKVMIPTFSPDGRMAAFVRDNNIWLKKFDYDTESQITKDGSFGHILNGVTDWVYEEEFIQTNLMSWSADSRFLAFVKSDETKVPTYAFQQFDGSLYPDFYSYKYPKAGQNNSTVGCYTYNIETKDTKRMDVPLDSDGYIPLIRFTPNPDQLAVMTLNRQQNIFKMYMVHPQSTLAKLALQDESQTYIDSDWILSIAFSKDRFAYVSERDGYAHIYLYSLTGALERQLTSGRWDVTAFYGLDPQTATVYYQTAEDSPLQRAVYKTDARGVKTKLTASLGTHTAMFSTNFRYFIDTYSNVSTPDYIAIYNDKGKELATLNNNQALKTALSQVRLPHKEFLTIDNTNGDALNAFMIKPSDFDASKHYPALLVQYSGPNTQQVTDKFGLDWYYYLAEQGYVILTVDGRGTAARGEQFRKCTYMQLGILESDDQIAAAKWLAQQSYIDGKRISIWGWSYGGYITLMSMSRGNGIFRSGISIAPVTDWRFYDSIYTERFMRTPNENFENYKRCSPLSFAGDLKGKLLLIHSTADDNVHPQNSMYYANALIDAGIDFEMFIYPNKNHSLLGTKTREHLYTRIIRFLQFEN
ncbi:MAG: S9 family peptidase [Candidatus Symbiothrix sp.]|jgi:dipeptidyl-peptidase-4|nr:S9 family peptidase [Candidatus Symbiothrix sp.]